MTRPKAFAQRPRRGAPHETRARLLRAAAAVFNDVGFAGTDSNAIARAAGYAPGTFYNHFPDKRAIFLAVYAELVDATWSVVASEAGQTRKAKAKRAAAIVDFVLDQHRQWWRFRSSLHALTAVDAKARRFWWKRRQEQLAQFERLRDAPSSPRATREDDALLLFTIERTADALADGETTGLRLDGKKLRTALVSLVAARLPR